MANIKIQQLTKKASPDSTDVFIIEDSVATKKISGDDLTSFLIAGVFANMGGRIVESGDKYIKFDNGLMIQWGHIIKDIDINTAWGSVYYGSMGTANFDIAFTATPWVFFSLTRRISGANVSGGVISASVTRISTAIASRSFPAASFAQA